MRKKINTDQYVNEGSINTTLSPFILVRILAVGEENKFRFW
jgi:hypothetical protein